MKQLYINGNEIEKMTEYLVESKSFCESHEIGDWPFYNRRKYVKILDQQELLNEYQKHYIHPATMTFVPTSGRRYLNRDRTAYKEYSDGKLVHRTFQTKSGQTVIRKVLRFDESVAGLILTIQHNNETISILINEKLSD